VGCPKTEESKKWEIMHPFICKAHLTQEAGLPKKKIGEVLRI